MTVRCDQLNCPTCHPSLPERACDRCGAALEFVLPDHTSEQYRGALHVELFGGYGEYIDRMPMGQAPTAVLCKACVDALRTAEPWLERTLATYFAQG
jgi:hypothetical protein